MLIDLLDFWEFKTQYRKDELTMIHCTFSSYLK